MAPSPTAWAATRRTRRTTWVRRTVIGSATLVATAALVVFAATGGLDDLRQVASSDTFQPVIAPVDRAVEGGSPVSAPEAGTALEPSDPLPEPEGSSPVDDVVSAPVTVAPDPPPGQPPADGTPVDDRADVADSDENAGAEGDESAGEGEASLAEIQEQLQELGYLVGPADGVHGAQTRAAVMAFQRVNGLQVDGVIGPRTRQALADPLLPELAGGPATRIEVDLDRQLLHLVEEGTRRATIHVSSGSGQPYTTASGGTAYSNTPIGEFTIERRIAGARKASLGTLYDPLYFYRGWAIHGSNSVPAEPASHGCIRVTRADGRWLFERVPDGIPVQVSGGEHVFTPSGA